MATKGGSDDNKWLGYVIGCGVPAGMLGSFAMTDQILARPGLVAEVVVATIAICGLNAWAWARHRGQFGTVAALGGILMLAVFIHCLGRLAIDYGETTITNPLAGGGRQRIGPLIDNYFKSLVGGVLFWMAWVIWAPRGAEAKAGGPVKPVAEVGDEL